MRVLKAGIALVELSLMAAAAVAALLYFGGKHGWRLAKRILRLLDRLAVVTARAYLRAREPRHGALAGGPGGGPPGALPRPTGAAAAPRGPRLSTIFREPPPPPRPQMVLEAPMPEEWVDLESGARFRMKSRPSVALKREAAEVDTILLVRGLVQLGFRVKDATEAIRKAEQELRSEGVEPTQELLLRRGLRLAKKL